MGASNHLATRARSSAELELGGSISEPYALRHGLVTFAALVIAGSTPLLAYLSPMLEHDRFASTGVLGAVSLFAVGAARARLIRGLWWKSGLEMLGVGSAAGVLSYFVGGSHQPVGGLRTVLIVATCSAVASGKSAAPNTALPGDSGSNGPGVSPKVQNTMAPQVLKH